MLLAAECGFASTMSARHDQLRAQIVRRHIHAITAHELFQGIKN